MAPVEKQKGICCISDEFWHVWELFARTNMRDLRNVNIYSVSNYIHRCLGSWGLQSNKTWSLQGVCSEQAQHKITKQEKEPKVPYFISVAKGNFLFYPKKQASNCWSYCTNLSFNPPGS